LRNIARSVLVGSSFDGWSPEQNTFSQIAQRGWIPVLLSGIRSSSGLLLTFRSDFNWLCYLLKCLKFRNICLDFPMRLGPEWSSLSLCRQSGDSGLRVVPVAVCKWTVMLGPPVGRAVCQRAWFYTPAGPWGGDPLLPPWMLVVFARC
jgi:hypothetical protein